MSNGLSEITPFIFINCLLPVTSKLLISIFLSAMFILAGFICHIVSFIIIWLGLILTMAFFLLDGVFLRFMFMSTIPANLFLDSMSQFVSISIESFSAAISKFIVAGPCLDGNLVDACSLAWECAPSMVAVTNVESMNLSFFSRYGAFSCAVSLFCDSLKFAVAFNGWTISTGDLKNDSHLLVVWFERMFRLRSMFMLPGLL